MSLPRNVNAHLVKIHTGSTLWTIKHGYSSRKCLIRSLVLCVFPLLQCASPLSVPLSLLQSLGGVPTASTVRSTDISLDLGGLFGGADLSSSNHYGAPIPPWEPGCQPGWYYGPNPAAHPDLPCLGGVRIMAMILECA